MTAKQDEGKNMTEIEKKDEILNLLTQALKLATEDDVAISLRGNHVYVDYGCSQFAVDITDCCLVEMVKKVVELL